MHQSNNTLTLFAKITPTLANYQPDQKLGTHSFHRNPRVGKVKPLVMPYTYFLKKTPRQEQEVNITKMGNAAINIIHAKNSNVIQRQ